MFQVQSYLPLSIVNFGVSKHYAGSMVSDRCPLGYLFYIHLTILTKAGPHDNVMTSAFEASLEVSRELGTSCYFIYI